MGLSSQQHFEMVPLAPAVQPLLFSLEKGIPNLETITHDGSMGLVYLHIEYFPLFPDISRKMGPLQKERIVIFQGKSLHAKFFSEFSRSYTLENERLVHLKITSTCKGKSSDVRRGCSRQMALTIQVCSFFLGTSQH